MALETSEEEQVEKIQTFLKENGWTLALALIVALGGNFGYRSWQNDQKAQVEAASDAFSNFQATVREGTTPSEQERAISQGTAFRVDFPDSHYAVLAALQIAKLQFQNDDFEAAETVLRDAATGASESLKPLVHLRLARLLSAMDRPEEGLTVLSGDLQWAGYASARHEAEGDLLYQLDRTDEARQAYQLAVNTAGDSAAPGLTMKVEDLTYAASETEDASVDSAVALEASGDTEEVALEIVNDAEGAEAEDLP